MLHCTFNVTVLYIHRFTSVNLIPHRSTVVKQGFPETVGHYQNELQQTQTTAVSLSIRFKL